MKLDDTDIKILKLLGTMKSSITTTDMAKELFIPKTEYELKQHDNFIRSRLKKLAKFGLVSLQEENCRTCYSLCEDCIVLSGTLKISVNGNVFKGQKGEYVFVMKNGFLKQILS